VRERKRHEDTKEEKREREESKGEVKEKVCIPNQHFSQISDKCPVNKFFSRSKLEIN
jgi:hypothetical protein